MPYQLKRLPDLPALIVTLDQRLDVTELRTMFRESHNLTRPEDEHIYRVLDFRNAHMPLPELLLLIHAAMQSFMPGAMLDPRIEDIPVGSAHWVHVARDWFSRHLYKGRHVPLFATPEAAVRYIQQREAGRNPVPTDGDNGGSEEAQSGFQGQ